MGKKLDASDNQKGRKQKIILANCIRRNLSSNRPSCKNDNAKIQINRKIAIENLKIMEKKYWGHDTIHGFLTDLKIAIGLTPNKGASEYGFVYIPLEGGADLTASLSVSNHHSNAITYINKDFNYEYNLRIVVRKSKIKGTFKPHNEVILDEYDYTGSQLKKVDNALSLIIKSITEFLTCGKYVDLTGIAVKHSSPEPI